MKVRMDFVTNSSSASFLLARSSGLNEKQKEAILKYVEKRFLGEKLPLVRESTAEEVEEFCRERDQEKVRDALDEGYSLYAGTVDYEMADISLMNIYERIWRLAEENGDGSFRRINTDLSY